MLCTQGISFRSDPQTGEALFADFHEQCAKCWTVTQMRHHWEDFPECELLGALFVWCMRSDLQDQDLTWWQAVMMSWQLGQHLLHAHDLAVQIQAWRPP